VKIKDDGRYVIFFGVRKKACDGREDKLLPVESKMSVSVSPCSGYVHQATGKVRGQFSEV
jgi:hypothetical protein